MNPTIDDKFAAAEDRRTIRDLWLGLSVFGMLAIVGLVGVVTPEIVRSSQEHSLAFLFLQLVFAYAFVHARMWLADRRIVRHSMERSGIDS